MKDNGIAYNKQVYDLIKNGQFARFDKDGNIVKKDGQIIPPDYRPLKTSIYCGGAYTTQNIPGARKPMCNPVFGNPAHKTFVT